MLNFNPVVAALGEHRLDVIELEKLPIKKQLDHKFLLAEGEQSGELVGEGAFERTVGKCKQYSIKHKEVSSILAIEALKVKILEAGSGLVSNPVGQSRHQERNHSPGSFGG